MKSTNRFLVLVQRNPIESASLSSIFVDATSSESAEIIEAMYVIGEQRSASGHPVGIQEITTAIGGLVSDQSILDAAVDVCMQGLMSTGYTESEAHSMVLDSTSSMLESHHKTNLQSITDELAEPIGRRGKNWDNLPSNFGPLIDDVNTRYELRRLIGSGSQGNVYEAIDRTFVEGGMPAFVAIKINRTPVAIKNAFEGSRARRIRHENVARVFDQGLTDDGKQFIVYELIDGLPLDKWLKHQGTQPSLRKACSLIISIAHGVQAAHNAGIVHRDLKPSNILINREGDPIITDFGISISEHNSGNSNPYGARGALAFIAPEQYDDLVEGRMPSSDIYSLGGILYWLITNHFPNGDLVDEALDWLENRCDGGPCRLNNWTVDSRLKAVLLKALAIDPGDRYQSVETFAHDLEAYLENRPIYWIDQSPLVEGILFAKRKPFVFLLGILSLIAATTTVGVWVNMNAALRQERIERSAAIEMESLQNQLDLEQARLDDLKEKSVLLKSLVETWILVVKENDDPKDARRNLLFLHSLTVNKFAQEDPELIAELIAQKLDVGEKYLTSLKTQSVSPLQIAYWHETLGIWNREVDHVRARGHLDSALQLVEDFAPEDRIWATSLNEKIHSLE